MEKLNTQTKERKTKIEKLKDNEDCLVRDQRQEEQVERQVIEKKGATELIDNLKDSIKAMILS